MAKISWWKKDRNYQHTCKYGVKITCIKQIVRREAQVKQHCEEESSNVHCPTKCICHSFSLLLSTELLLRSKPGTICVHGRMCHLYRLATACLRTIMYLWTRCQWDNTSKETSMQIAACLKPRACGGGQRMQASRMYGNLDALLAYVRWCTVWTRCQSDNTSKMSIIHFKASINAFDVKHSITTRIGATCSDRQNVKCNQKTTSVELRTILKGYVLLPLTLKDRHDRIGAYST